MNATRCKMFLKQIGQTWTKGGREVIFGVVSDGSPENKAFFEATPSGELRFSVSPAAAKAIGLDVASIGKEFYIDITPVPEVPA